MATIVIRNLDDETKRSLQLRAAFHRRSMEAEVRDILRLSVNDVPPLVLEPPAPDEPEHDLPLPDDHPANQDKQERPVPCWKAPPPRGVVITEINRQLKHLGMSEFALPDDFQIG